MCLIRCLKKLFPCGVFNRCYLFTFKLNHKLYFCRMQITSEMIDRLAHLARLEFSEAEKNELKADLERMIAFVEKLKEVDTTGVEPLLHMTDAVNVLRDDEVSQTISKAEALSNAPFTNGDFFITPKVIKKDSE